MHRPLTPRASTILQMLAMVPRFLGGTNDLTQYNVFNCSGNYCNLVNVRYGHCSSNQPSCLTAFAVL